MVLGEMSAFPLCVECCDKTERVMSDESCDGHEEILCEQVEEAILDQTEDGWYAGSEARRD